MTADVLHQEVLDASAPLSLATVYNALDQFADAGLLQKICVNGERAYFDTDPDSHHHFYVEAEDRIIDVAPSEIRLGRLQEPPPGYVVTKVDVVIRLERVDRGTSQPVAASPR